MTDLKTRAKEVHAAGVEARGDFTPEGAPKNMYRYWLRHSNSKRARQVRNGDVRENFCHFWRVVAIWGPAMFVRKRSAQFLDDNGAYILMTLSVLSLFALLAAAVSVEAVAAFFGMVLMFAVVAGLGGTGLVAGFLLALVPMNKVEIGYRDTWVKSDREWEFPLPKFWTKVAAVLTAPTALLGAAVAGVINVYRKNPDKFMNISLNVFSVIGVLYGASLAITAFVGGITSIGFWQTMGVIALIVAGVAALGGILWLGSKAITAVGDFIKGQRRLAEKRRDEARERARLARNKFFDEHGYYPDDKPTKAPRPPGAIAKFFTTLGDFVVLYAQVARVNKWKICPLVDIDDKEKIAA